MSSARLSNYAKRVNPTGQKRTAKLKVFNANGKVNRTLLRKLDENPLSYKLPRQFIYINDTNTIEQADQWLTSDRQMRMTLEDEYEVVGSNFIQTKWGNEQMASTYAFESMVATFNSPVRNKLAFDSVGREVFQRFKKKFKQQIKLHKGIRFQFASSGRPPSLLQQKRGWEGGAQPTSCLSATKRARSITTSRQLI